MLIIDVTFLEYFMAYNHTFLPRDAMLARN